MGTLTPSIANPALADRDRDESRAVQEPARPASASHDVALSVMLKEASSGKSAAPGKGRGKPPGKTQMLHEIQRSYGNAKAQQVVRAYRSLAHEGFGNAHESAQNTAAESPSTQGMAALLAMGDTHGSQVALARAAMTDASATPSLFLAPQSGAPHLQTSLNVSSPHDPAEKEAESSAKQVVGMAVPDKSVALVGNGGNAVFRQVAGPSKNSKPSARLVSPYITRNIGSAGEAQSAQASMVQRKPADKPKTSADIAADIQGSTSGGTPLPMGVRRFMEPRFKADFSKVKIHTGDKSVKLNRQLNAKAFATGNHVFFGQGKFQPDSQEGKELIAHELTHTIQQGGSIQRSAEPLIHEHSEPQVQRAGLFGLDPMAFIADKAASIPGFTMLTVVIGYNPITNIQVDRSAGNLLKGAIEMIPVVGVHISEALNKHGIFDKVSQWTLQKFDALKNIGGDIVGFIKGLKPSDILHPGDVWERGKQTVTSVIDRIKNFASGLKDEIVTFIKDAILKPIAAFAKANVPNGYDLLSAVLGNDPISGEKVPPTAENIIGPFMKMIGQEEVWNNMKEAKAIPRAWAWFQGAMGKVKGFVQEIPTLFKTAFLELQVIDIVLIPRAFAKLAGVFGSFAVEFITWGGEAVWNLLEIIFDVVAPGILPYIKKAQAAFRTILKDPIGFVGNLVRAGKQGFEMFAGNILEHLKAALIKWIVGPLADAGVYIPTAFTLIEIVKLVLSVLGLTWQNIRSKLVKIIPEPVLVGLEKTASILVTLVKDGPAAAWEQIKTELSELKDQLISQVSEMVTTEVVKAAVMKLVSMLNPAGAIIQAIIAVYNTITFFIEKAKQIAAVVAAFIDSISAIAAGQVAAAASKVEQTLANTLTVVIAFLAKFAGLGNIPGKVTGIIKKIRKPIDKGLDKIVTWLGNMLKKFGGAVAQAGLPQDPNERLKLGMEKAVGVVKRLPGNAIGKALITPVLAPIKIRYGFQQLEPILQEKKWYLRGQINPSLTIDTGKKGGTDEPITLKPGSWIKAKYVDGMWVAKITTISEKNVTIWYNDDRKGREIIEREEFIKRFKKGEITEYDYDKTNREKYVGSNVSREVLLALYKSEGTYYKKVDDKHKVQFPKQKGGKWHFVSDCDASHEPTDAVTYWNRTGHKHGALSPQVRAWMTNPKNYVFEPLSSNRARGSREGKTYRPPAKV